ncbi:MAG: VCBS repeat-containing protein [Acidobacteriota bacterium]
MRLPSAKPRWCGESPSTNPDLFEPYQIYQVGSRPDALAVGDVNGDGRNEVVVATGDSGGHGHPNDYCVFVFRQNAAGGLSRPARYRGGNGCSLDIGDINGDGRNDIVVASDSGIGAFLQNKNHRLGRMVSYGCPGPDPHNPITRVRTGDFNSDGRQDVVAIHSFDETNEVYVLYQRPGGKLQFPSILTLAQAGSKDLECEDLNNDGLQDIQVMSSRSCSNYVGVLWQKAGGGFESPTYYDFGGWEPLGGMGVGDVNNDALSDIVVSIAANQPRSKIGILLQKEWGFIRSAVLLPSYDCPEPVEIADVDGNGRNDILVAHGGWEALAVYRQKSDSLLPYELYPIPYASHYNPHSLAVGDVSGDGAPDVVLADYNGYIVILYNRTMAPCFSQGRAGTASRLRP